MAGQVADALQGLTQYLFTKNQQLDQKEKEKRVQLTAEHVADQFANLPPDADPRMMQQLQFEMIEDAAALGGLQENLPLITGLYQTAMQTRQLEKTEREDEALGRIISKEFGVEGEGLSGAQKSQLAQLFKQYEKDYTVVDTEGKTSVQTYNHKNEKVFELQVNAIGLEDQFNYFKREALFKHALEKDLQKFKMGLELSGSTDPQLMGKKLLKGQQGLKGEVIWEADNGDLFTKNKQGQVIAYDGALIDRKGAGGNIADLVGTLDELKKATGSDKIKLMLQLNTSTAGRDILKKLLGDTDITKVGPGGEEMVDQGKLQAFDAAIESAQLGDLLKELEIPAAGPEADILGEWQLRTENVKSLERYLYDQFPESDRDMVTDPKTWNTGVNEVRKIIEQDVDPEAKMMINNYIGKALGLPAGTTITMSHYQNMTMPQKMHLNEMISAVTIDVIPTFEDFKKVDFADPNRRVPFVQ